MVAIDPLNLAVVGNCEVSALIDARGSLVWMCLPRPDGDPVFSALLTPELGAAEQGVFAFDLVDFERSEQHYVRNTAVVETRLWDRHGGGIAITDFCPRFRTHGRMFRPMMLVRMVRPLGGRPLVKIRLRPSADHGARAAHVRPGSHHVHFSTGEVAFRVTADASISALTRGRPVVVDQPLTFVLGPDETVNEMPAGLSARFLEETRIWWQDWVRSLAIPFEWQEEVIRAAITLKLCAFEDSGAVLAALTTSIPESPDSGRTWDYRYCWLRDAYFVVQALNRLGATRTMEGYLHFIDNIVASTDEVELQPVYPLTGDGVLTERIVPALPGFLGMGPVRIGNQAAQQIQHDVYGAIILAVSQLFFDERLVHPGDAMLFAQLENVGRRAVQVCGLPDAGPWELRGSKHVHTFSVAMSWAGCDRLARIARRLGLAPAAEQWRRTADELRDTIIARAWSEERGAFTATYGGTDLDASALLLPELGLIDAMDPRFVSTVEAIGRELTEGDLLFRYRQSDDFGKPHAAFTVCAFWYVSALAAIGRKEEARERFARLLQRRNALGLLSEDIDPDTGQLWGNFPQTYSMVGIISCAVRLSRSWDEAL